jgi:hypothetical protein
MTVASGPEAAAVIIIPEVKHLTSKFIILYIRLATPDIDSAALDIDIVIGFRFLSCWRRPN